MDSNDEQASSRPSDDSSPSSDVGQQPPQASLDFSTLETPDELLPHAFTPDVTALQLPPAIDRDRPVRSPILPAWVWPALATLVLVIAIGVATWFVAAAAAQVEVPDVTGRSYGLARTMLAQKGLEATIVERRFSALPVDQVLSQTPVPSTTLRRGDAVMLVVSAGTEETLLPDVIGDGIILARGTLESLGLVVVVDSVQSEEASDTVLGTMPAPGTVVRSGDVVRVQVSAPLTDGALLQPYDMQGISVTIDPVPLSDQTPDIALEVSRRLRSLLEASGATVTVLRGTNADDTDDAARARQARRTNPTVAIGVSAEGAGAGGRSIAPRSDEGTTSALSAQLSAEATRRLAEVASPAVETSGSVDAVFRRLEAPWIRVGLGSFADPADKSAFGDPRWADRVARAIYAAVGEVFASEDGL